jgi:putative transposase
MARLARIVIPSFPHHVTQRGNRRETVLFEDGDYQFYLDLLKAALKKHNTEMWAYCLMPNHVHLILVPSHPDGLRATLGEVHRRYTGFINTRYKWTGHLWQGRFGSVAMDEAHFANAVRYVSLNPVRAKLVEQAQGWKWSSVSAHLSGKSNGVVNVRPVLDRFPDFAKLLAREDDKTLDKALRMGEGIGRPLGDTNWLDMIEQKIGKSVRPQKRGPKPNPLKENNIQIIK